MDVKKNTTLTTAQESVNKPLPSRLVTSTNLKVAAAFTLSAVAAIAAYTYFGAPAPVSPPALAPVSPPALAPVSPPALAPIAVVVEPSKWDQATELVGAAASHAKDYASAGLALLANNRPTQGALASLAAVIAVLVGGKIWLSCKAAVAAIVPDAAAAAAVAIPAIVPDAAAAAAVAIPAMVGAAPSVDPDTQRAIGYLVSLRKKPVQGRRAGRSLRDENPYGIYSQIGKIPRP
jgi:hypothetical protein